MMVFLGVAGMRQASVAYAAGPARAKIAPETLPQERFSNRDLSCAEARSQGDPGCLENGSGFHAAGMKNPRSGDFSDGGNGAEEKTRTSDPRITNALLYQLSYFGTL